MPLACRVLLTGAQGQLGRSLQAIAPAHWQLEALGHQALDISDAARVQACVEALQPHIIINAAAYNAVDAAETDEAAWQVNAMGPGYLAKVAKQVGARLVHVSTDYVFNGRDGPPYSEEDQAIPLNRYGVSKLMGEYGVLDVLPEALVLRTSWVFSEYAPNFVNTVLTQLRRGASLRIAHDQFSAPTYAGHLAQVIVQLLERPDVPGGLYHYRDTPALSRYDYACDILALLRAQQPGLMLEKPQAVPSTAFGSAAVRPVYSVLACQRLAALGIMPKPWLISLKPVIASLW